MSVNRLLFGTVLLAFAIAQVGLAGGPQDKSAENPKEQTVEGYDSKTRGALQVKAVRKDCSDWFRVEKDGTGLGGVPPTLNTTVELAPGAYVVFVNGTQRKVTVAAGKKTVLLAGELFVEAKKGTGGWYTPYEGKEARLSSSPPLVNTPISLFAGKYTVVWSKGGVGRHQDLGEAEVKPGKRTVLKK